MTPHENAETAFLTAKAVGDPVDCKTQHARMQAAGVRIREATHNAPYGIVAVFEDLHGAPLEPDPAPLRLSSVKDRTQPT